MSAATASRQPRRGRPATASRENVLSAARAQFMAGDRVDLTIVARDLGLGRATIYRWFGSRERLVSEVIADESEVLIRGHRRAVRRRGVQGLLEVFDRINRSLASSMPLRRFVEQEGAAALRLLTSSTGAVQCRGVSAHRRDDSGRGQPPAATSRRPIPRRSPTPSSACARPFSTTTPRSGSAAITSGSTRSRPRCSAFRTPRRAPEAPRRSTRTLLQAGPRAVRRRPNSARSPPWIPLGHRIIATMSTIP